MIKLAEANIGAKPVWMSQRSCRVCGGAIALIADLGMQCIGSIFPLPGEHVSRAPLRLMRCEDCALMQLGDTTAPELLYTPAYGYKSGINERMVAHLRGIVGRLAPLVEPGDFVLDIGCNDGTLLREWARYGAQRVGYDPIGIPVEDCEVVRDIFRADGRKYKAITSIAMFYDLQDPIAFAKDVRASLAPGGIWALEVGYVGALRAGCWDAICHEHLEYYGLTQIVDIARAADLHVIAHEFTATNGGSLLVTLAAERADKGATERTLGIEQQWSWGGFSNQVEQMALQIYQLVDRFDRVWALGASTKGNTILQTADFDSVDIICAVERNAAKVGRETPGSKIQIRGEDAFAQYKHPDALLVLPYHFRDGLIKRTRAAGFTGAMLFPLPHLEIL